MSDVPFFGSYGSQQRVDRVTKRFGLESAFRARGRPYKEPQNNGS